MNNIYEKKSRLIGSLIIPQIIIGELIESEYIIKLLDYTIKKNKFITYWERYNIDLYDYMMNNILTEEMIKEILYNITCGLYVMHENGWAHGDIKTENILIKYVEEDEKIKMRYIIGDLDSAYPISSDISTTHTTFISPEYKSYRFQQKYNMYGKCSDIWALGYMIYEIMGYSIDMKIKNIEPSSEYMERIYKRYYRKLSHFKYENKYPEIEKICSKMLSRNPLLRPTAIDILNEQIYSDRTNYPIPEIKQLTMINKNDRFYNEKHNKTINLLNLNGINLIKAIQIYDIKDFPNIFSYRPIKSQSSNEQDNDRIEKIKVMDKHIRRSRGNENINTIIDLEIIMNI